MPRANAPIDEPDHAALRAPADFEQLYQQLWRPMVLLATGLVDEVSSAEEVVQDAFAALYQRWSQLRDRRAAVAYLRVSVVNAARSQLRRRRTARKHLYAVYDEPTPAADAAALLTAEHDLVRQALATLPERQREVLSLRYLADLPDAEIGAATGLSLPGVRSSASRGLAALRTILGGQL